MNNRIVQSQWGLYTIHLMRRSRCFVFDEQLRVCEVLTSQNQSVQLRLICIYVCPTSAHRGFRYGYRRYKGNNFTLKTTLFGWKSMILRSDLTLLNMNMSKNSTFAWFFLLKSLYYQWLLVSLQRQSSPSLLTMLKSCEAFFVYIRSLSKYANGKITALHETLYDRGRLDDSVEKSWACYFRWRESKYLTTHSARPSMV